MALGGLISLVLALLRYREIRNQFRLVESQEQLRLFVDHAPAALAMFDQDMRYLAVSQRWIGDYQLDPKGLIGRLHYEVFPEVTKTWRDVHQRALAGEIIRSNRDAFTRADGHVQWLKWEVRPWKRANGTIGGIVIVSEDVTLLEQAEREIRKLNTSLEAQVAERTVELETARRFLRAVLDAVPSVIAYWDGHLINQMANHAYADWFGMAPESLPGRHLRETLGDALFLENWPHIQAAIRGEAQRFEMAVPRPDGKGVRYALAHYLPDKVGDRVAGFYAVIHDVTELTESRERLARTLRENDILLRSID